MIKTVFLMRYVEIFRIRIFQDQMLQLIHKMNVFSREEDVNRVLKEVDPYKNNQISYSELVQYFSTNMVEKGSQEYEEDTEHGKLIPIMERLFEDTKSSYDSPQGIQERAGEMRNGASHSP